MYKIDSRGSILSLPAPASLGTEGFWSDGNAGAGILATEIDQDWLNMVQGSVLAPIDIAGIAHSKTDYSQLYLAILSCARLADTGAANALAATPAGGVTLPALANIPDGFTVKLIPRDTTTSTAPTFAFNGGPAVTITDPLGNALAAGDIIAGIPAELMKAGAGTPTWWLLNRKTMLFAELFYDAHGTYTPTAPNWATLRYEETQGAGGGGSGGAGSSGGAGGAAKGFFAQTPGASLTVVVGQAGAAASSGAAAGNGGTSTVSGGTSSTGGVGGASGPGAGGVGSGGSRNYTGQGGTDLDGVNPNAIGGNAPLGGMGGVCTGSGGGSAATFGGGGGANANAAAGQAGADGTVYIRFMS